MPRESKVLAYLREREGQEVSYEELLAAGLAPRPDTLSSYLSRLVSDPRSGVTRTGEDTRRPGVYRGYRYDTPEPEAEPVMLDLRRVGSTVRGNPLAIDDETGELFEIVPIGKLEGP